MPDAGPLDLLLPVLRCPACGDRLSVDGSALHCPGGHAFDVARQGYAGLLTGAGATSADDGPGVRARRAFLDTGHYSPIRDLVARLAAEAAPPGATVLDVGCGTGYHLAGVLDALPAATGLGLDTSPHALRAAARAHPRAAAAAADAFRPLPVATASVDVLLDVFAPRNPREFARVLRPDGRLVVVRPDAAHLAELRAASPGMVAVDPTKERRLHEALDPCFEAVAHRALRHAMRLAEPEADALLAMTPSRPDPHDGARTPGWAQRPREVTASVLATAYRPR